MQLAGLCGIILISAPTFITKLPLHLASMLNQTTKIRTIQVDPNYTAYKYARQGSRCCNSGRERCNCVAERTTASSCLFHYPTYILLALSAQGIGRSTLSISSTTRLEAIFPSIPWLSQLRLLQSLCLIATDSWHQLPPSESLRYVLEP
jgi:hypothetical protein